MKHLKLLCLAVLLSACADEEKGKASYSGYIEGIYVYAVAPQSGYINKLDVKEGDLLAIDQAVAELDQSLQDLQIEQLDKELKSQFYVLKDMDQGARKEEIAVVVNQALVVQEQLKLANKNIERMKELIAQNLASQSELDILETERDVLKRKLDSYDAQIDTLKLSARDNAKFAQNEVYAAKEAKLAQQKWLKAQRQILAPGAGSVQQIFYRNNEFVSTGSPIISILLNDLKKVRFTVPQSALQSFQLGNKVWVKQDNLEKPFQANVSFVSKKAEFTPPVLYGPRVRDKLVFMIEAEMEENSLNIGQPVDVYVE